MRRFLAALAVSLPLLGAGVGVGPLPGVQPACASTDQHAVLVVDTGSRVLDYCVAMGSGSVSGIDLVKLAAQQYGLDYNLGYGGEAVCRLAGVGVDGGDCFSDFPDFWGYWRGDGGGGWTWSSTGAGNTTVHSGDVEGWSWGSGKSGSSHPQPPQTSFSDVCTGGSTGGSTHQHDGNNNANRNGGGSGTGVSSQQAGSAGGTSATRATRRQATRRSDRRTARRKDRRHSRRHDRRRSRRQHSGGSASETAGSTGTAPSTGTAVGQPAASPASPGSSGSAGILAAVLAVAALGGAGAAISWRRRRE